MTHSANLSTSTTHTFDLGDDGEGRSMSAGGDSQRTKRASSSYGVALTSTPSQDERAALPSQQKSNAWKRKSAPGGQEYEELFRQTSSGNFEDLLRQRGAGDRNSVHNTSYNDASKRRSKYFEEEFQYKDNAMTQSKEKVQRQSPVIAELKTNVIIKDEFTLVTDLSYHLAQRYTRPDSCIMIKIDHSACLALGGNFDPCYFLTINAVPSTVGPTTNKRNAVLIQSFMTDILSVPADRGIVTFRAVKEENLAMNGTTMLGETERQEKSNSVRDQNGIKSAIKDASRRSMTFPNSQTKLNGDYRSNGHLAAGSTSSPSITPPPPQAQIKDQAGSADKDGRPLTAHGGFDGLRMNGVSTEQLVGQNSKLPSGRPKTFGGSSTPASVQESMKQEPLPHVSHQTTQQSKRSSMQRASIPKRVSQSQVATAKPNGNVPSRYAQNGRTNSSTSTPAAAPAIAKPKHTPLIKEEQRPRNTYLDGVSSLTKKNPTPALKPDEGDVDDDDIPLAKTAAGRANTAAKRRSTITATPQMPLSRPKKSGTSNGNGVLKPPPVPDEAKSTSSRLSKRKSFMRMFKRSSVPAWYEQ